MKITFGCGKVVNDFNISKLITIPYFGDISGIENKKELDLRELNRNLTYEVIIKSIKQWESYDNELISIIWEKIKNLSNKNLERLINRNKKLDCEDILGNTAIIFATCLKNNNLIKLLLKQGVNINKKNKNGHTALIYACHSKNYEIIKLLINHGADVNASDNNGMTALMYTAYSRNYKIIKLLVESGADINIINDDNEKAINLLIGDEYQFQISTDPEYINCIELLTT